ncbi:B12-binding domain-containing protein [Streptomyces sp. NPDC086091]|uniref:cobalamin B12-binding domain-containing protein n=1 Tax=Streptomyces sp. NPDC086091 TaxID=3365751 RepID=UPI00382AC0BB
MTAAPPADRELAELCDRLWTAAVDGDETAAVDIVTGAAVDGWSIESLLLDVVAAVQGRLGSEWAADRITVADEHVATAVNDRVVSALAARVPPPEDTARRVTVACVDNEWHALPARLVAELLATRGWRVDFLGAQVPTARLVAHLHATAPEAVLLSASIPTHLPTAHAALTACQSIGVSVLVGGAAFGPDGRHARALHADAWAADAREAAVLLEKGIHLRAGSTPRHQVDDLPHLADQEYTLITRGRSTLVRRVLHELCERHPPARSYTPAQLDRTAEDIVHIVDFLATALYVDDPGLFHDFTVWTAHILASRGVPPASLRLGLTLLGGHLHDFPRAHRILREAIATLDQSPPTPVPAPVPGPGTSA